MGFFSKFFGSKEPRQADPQETVAAEERGSADFTAAVLMQMRGENDAALAAYQEMTDRFPDDNLAPFFAAAIKAGSGSVEDAVAVLRSLSQRCSEAEQGISQVIIQELAAQLSDSSQHGRIPGIAELIVSFGDNVKAAGFVYEAAVLYEVAVALLPDRANVLHRLGDTLHDLRLYEYAESVLQEALKHAPNHWDSLYSYALLLQQLGRDKEALPYYEKATVFNPDHVNCRNNYGSALMRTQRLEEALQQCNAAFGLEPENPFVQINLGNIRYLMREPDKAREHFRKAIELNPEHPAAYFGLAAVEQALGSPREVVQELYQKVLAVNPQIAEAHHALGTIYASAASPEALQHFEQALALNPNLRDLHRDFAVAYLQLGRRDEALQQLKLALEKNPADAEAANMIANLEQGLKG